MNASVSGVVCVLVLSNWVGIYMCVHVHLYVSVCIGTGTCVQVVHAYMY